MTLAVPERVMGSLTAGEVAVRLGPEYRREWAAGIVLRGVSDAPTAVEPRSPASFIAADALSAVEGSQRTQWLALLELLVMSWAKSARCCPLITSLEVTFNSDLSS
jgi:hypothetical protein